MSKFIKDASRIRHPERIISEVKAKQIDVTKTENKFVPLKYKSPSEYYKKYTKPRYHENTIPKDASEIKGIDSMAYKWFYKNKMQFTMPKIYKDPFIEVTLYPDYHFISGARKSNVAIASFNTAVPIQNDSEIEKGILQYKGQYKNNRFFQERRNPFDTAVGRSKFRKMFKQWLVDAIQDKPIDKFRGVYFVKVYKIPESEQDKQIVSEGLKKMKLPPKLQEISKRFKGKIDSKPYNTYNEWVLPLSQVKTPFKK